MRLLNIYCLLLVFYSISTNGFIPKIAVVSAFEPENSESPDSAKISNTYVRWIEDVGGEVVPILPWHTNDQITDLLSKTNGVLWLGGTRNLTLTGSFETLNSFILSKVIEFNNNGTYYPLLGICQGFELLHVLIADTTEVLSNFDSYNYMLPLEFDMEKAKNTAIYQFFSDEDLKFLRNDNSTIHMHYLGTELNAYEKYPELKYFFEILSTGKDINNKTFAAIVKAKNFPIYGLQFHPEKVKYDRDIKSWANSNERHIRVNDNFGLFFIEECRKNSNRMNLEDEENLGVINSFEQLPTKTGENVYLYIFNKNYTIF